MAVGLASFACHAEPHEGPTREEHTSGGARCVEKGGERHVRSLSQCFWMLCVPNTAVHARVSICVVSACFTGEGAVRGLRTSLSGTEVTE